MSVVRKISYCMISVAFTPLLIGCSSGPSTQEEVCAAYDELSGAMRSGNVFSEIKGLGDTAARFPNDDGVRQDGEALKAIADKSTTDGNELNNASMSIAALCGAPPLTFSSF